MKTYLTVATHWHVPGIRQYASPDRPAAERKAAELVDELREDFHQQCARETWRGDHVPPSVANGGGNWEATLRALQLARLIDVYGGEGEANDALFSFCEGSGRDEPPLIGDGFPGVLEGVIADFVDEDEHDSDGIGFPRVWIEEVEQADAAPTPLDRWLTVIRAQRAAWALRQAPAGQDNQNRDQEEADTVVAVLDDIIAAATGDQPTAAELDATADSDNNCCGCGNPIGEEHADGCDEAEELRFLNKYRCERCNHEWEDEWSCACDDDCPVCGARHMSPYQSDELTD